MAPPKEDRKRASGSGQQGGQPKKGRQPLTEEQRDYNRTMTDIIQEHLEDPTMPEDEAFDSLCQYLSQHGFASKHPSTILVWASKGGHVRVLRQILLQGIHIKERYLFLALCNVTERNNVPAMKLLIEHKAPLTFGNLDKEEPVPEEELARPRATAQERVDSVLIWAVKGMAHASARFLLEAGEDANAKGYEFGSAIYFATTKNDRTMVALLLEFGADIEVGSGGADTPLSQAVKLGYGELAAFLIARGANVDHDDESGYTVAHHAAWPGSSPEIMKIVVEGGANINVVARNGSTPLSIAAQAGCVRMVQYLHKAGAQAGVLHPKRQKWPLITELALRGDAVMYGLVFKLFGTSVVNHKYPLWYAVLSSHVGVVRMGIAKGEDATMLNGGTERMTYLHAAALKNSYECVPPLVEAGCDINAVNGKGYTALHLAVINSHFETAYVLCKLGANMAALDSKGSTPVHHAVRLGKVDIFNLLVKSVRRTVQESKDFLGHRDQISGTVLHAAVHAGHLYILRQLLRFGADPLVVDHNGRNAVQLAKDLRREEQFGMLYCWVTKRPPIVPYRPYPDMDNIDLPDELEGLIHDEAAVTNIEVVQDVVYVPINETVDPHPDLVITEITSLAIEEVEVKQEMPATPPFVPNPPTPFSDTGSPSDAGNIERASWTSSGANTTGTEEKNLEDIGARSS